jgi:hypothetical protein
MGMMTVDDMDARIKETVKESHFFFFRFAGVLYTSMVGKHE